jgi:hypothetical protein
MSDCPYYKYQTQSIQRNPISSSRQPQKPEHTKIPWCEHPKHSPVSKVIATTALGGANQLNCGGDRNKCPLAKDLFEDI